jgi:hypothetical protein
LATGYVKVYGDMLLNSTVWVCSSPETKLLWITMLVMADKNGLVMASVPGLAQRATITIEQTVKGLEELSSPDRYSRTKEYEGRRIEEIDGGWLVLNYGKYRDFRTERQVREAERKARWRAKVQSEFAGETDLRDKSHMSRDVPAGHAPTPTPSPTPTPDSPKGSPVVDPEDQSTGKSLQTSPGHVPAVLPVKAPAKETANWINETLHELEAVRFEAERLLWEERTVFAFWVWRMKKDPKRTVLTDDRKTRLKRYLKIYGLEDCMLAVEGALHHRDHNHKDGSTYHELEHIFKLREGSGTVEKLAEAGRRKRTAVDKVLQRLRAQGYIPTGAEDDE